MDKSSVAATAATWCGSVSSKIVLRAVATAAGDTAGGTTAAGDTAGGTTAAGVCRAPAAVAAVTVVVGTGTREAEAMGVSAMKSVDTTVTMIVLRLVATAATIAAAAAAAGMIVAAVAVAVAICATTEVVAAMVAAMPVDRVEATKRGLPTPDLRAGTTKGTDMVGEDATTPRRGTGAPPAVMAEVVAAPHPWAAIDIGRVV